MTEKIIEEGQIEFIKGNIEKAIHLPEGGFKDDLLIKMKAELHNNYFVIPNYITKQDTKTVSKYFKFINMNKKILTSGVVAIAIVGLIANTSYVNVAFAANEVRQQINNMTAEEFVKNFQGLSKEDLNYKLSITNILKNAEIISAEQFKDDLMSTIFPNNLPTGTQAISVTNGGIITKDEQIKQINESVLKIDKVLKIKDPQGNDMEIALDKNGKVVSAFGKAEISAGSMDNLPANLPIIDTSNTLPIQVIPVDNNGAVIKVDKYNNTIQINTSSKELKAGTVIEGTMIETGNLKLIQ